ncbi:Somatostatin [Manis pentadactyla]|nr:Somatostatin [Manis pentadactyla]
MLSCRLQCALAALSIVLALGGVTGAPSDPRLRQFLQKSLAAAAGKQELAKYFLAELLSEPNQTENDALEPEDLSQAAEQDEMRLELQRTCLSVKDFLETGKQSLSEKVPASRELSLVVLANWKPEEAKIEEPIECKALSPILYVQILKLRPKIC